MTPDEAVTKLTEALKVPVANAATFGATGPERPLWAAPDNYVMVWSTDTGLDVQVVAVSEDSCASLAAHACRALGVRTSSLPAPEPVTDVRRSGWVATFSA